MFLSYTWLGRDCVAVLIESNPPYFSFMSEARMHRKGGGVAIFRNKSSQYRKIKRIRSSCQAIKLTIYRPPKHNGFSKLLSIICINFDCLVLMGDFNINLDNISGVVYDVDLCQRSESFILLMKCIYH